MARTSAERQRDHYWRNRESVLQLKKDRANMMSEAERGMAALYRMTRYYTLKGGSGVPRDRLIRLLGRYPSCEAIRERINAIEN